MGKHTWEYVTETATTDAGMTKADRARFHFWNPNGVVAALPAHDEFRVGNCFLTGLSFLYGRFDNYHAQKIASMARGETRFTHWDIGYHAAKCRGDANKAREAIAAKTAEFGDTCFVGD